MKFEQLVYLSEAAKYKSISVAAEKNYISQPSLSGAISKLEKELGVELLNRNSKGVTPTEIGEEVLEKARDILEMTQEIRDIASEYERKGTVSISSIPSFCERIVPQTMVRIRENNLALTLNIITGESEDVARDVSSGVSSLGFLIHYNGLEDNYDLQYTPLFKDEYVLYVGPFSPYWEADSISMDEVINEPYIAYREEFLKKKGGLSSMFDSGHMPNVVFRTNECTLLKQMVAQDNYVVFFPRFMSRDDFFLQNGLVRALPVRDADLEFEVGFVESTKYKPGKIEHAFLDVLGDTLDCDSQLILCL